MQPAFQDIYDTIELFPDCVGECYDLVDLTYTAQPRDKRTLEYKSWKDYLSRLVDHCNQLTGRKTYHRPS